MADKHREESSASKGVSDVRADEATGDRATLLRASEGPVTDRGECGWGRGTVPISGPPGGSESRGIALQDGLVLPQTLQTCLLARPTAVYQREGRTHCTCLPRGLTNIQGSCPSNLRKPEMTRVSPWAVGERRCTTSADWALLATKTYRYVM